MPCPMIKYARHEKQSIPTLFLASGQISYVLNSFFLQLKSLKNSNDTLVVFQVCQLVLYKKFIFLAC